MCPGKIYSNSEYLNKNFNSIGENNICLHLHLMTILIVIFLINNNCLFIKIVTIIPNFIYYIIYKYLILYPIYFYIFLFKYMFIYFSEIKLKKNGKK